MIFGNAANVVSRDTVMTFRIDITIENDKLFIREESCLPEEYQISEDMPALIDEVCEHLHDYLEGLG